tara:strand:- start:382 stop:579 length:198 start_codon:yes stop_codon:yes gene_type:complete
VSGGTIGCSGRAFARVVGRPGSDSGFRKSVCDKYKADRRFTTLELEAMQLDEAATKLGQQKRCSM